MKDNRREFIKKSASLAAAVSAGRLSYFPESVNESNKKETRKTVAWPVTKGPDTPKLCVDISNNASANQMRQIKQIGIDYVLTGGPMIPWKEGDLRSIMDRFKVEGLTVINMMISGFPNVIYGREGKDFEIAKVKESLISAGAVGLPVVEYNFYADRLIEGYNAKEGRGGSGITTFNYESVKNLPPTIQKLQ